VATSAAILAIAASAQAIVLLTLNLDVSVGSIMGCTAYLTGRLGRHNHPGVTPVATSSSARLRAGLGLINGFPRRYGKVPVAHRHARHMSLYRGFTYIYAPARRSPRAGCRAGC